MSRVHILASFIHIFVCNSCADFVHKIQIPLRPCEDCGGSGLCSECKGEGFVLKKLSDENAERARLAAKNMATRFTAAYKFLVLSLFFLLETFNFQLISDLNLSQAS